MMRKLAAAAVLLSVALASGASARAAVPVPSLQSRATEQAWHALVARAHTRTPTATRDCRPTRLVFYTSTDWLRLATKLAANASPCAQYYVSVPPLAADKTKFRYDQGWRIDALGPQFHALAEINFTGWSTWVAAGSGGWYDAGVQARRNMALGNFDVNRGDTWALNEASSAVRAGTGNARQNLRDFLRGLYEGDGGPAVKGVLFVIGVDQANADLSSYKTNLQGWLQDAAFWTDLTSYVSDLSQEVYGDVRDYAVPGSTAQVRRDYLNDYLQHPLALALAGPPGVVQSYLPQAYSPVANAAWPWESSYGYTNVPYDLMEQYVSAQVYAMRAYDQVHALPQDHFGFAWAPRFTGALSTADFNAQTAAILDRLGAAIRDSGETGDPTDPGVGACGPPGQNLWCGGDLAGAGFTGAWKTLAAWTYPPAVLVGAPSSAIAGVATVGFTVQAQGATQATLSSNSPRGRFAPSASGPWTSTLVLPVAPDASASAPVYYEDTRAGLATLTVTIPGRPPATQAVGVSAGRLARLRILPGSARLRLHATRLFRASGTDAYGNQLAVAVRWSLRPRTTGVLRNLSATGARFVARRRGTGAIVATAGRVTARAHVAVAR